MQPFGQTPHALLQSCQSKKHKREACKRSACRRHAPAAQKLDQRSYEDHWQRSSGERDPHADKRDEPASSRRADIGAKDKTQSLRKGQ